MVTETVTVALVERDEDAVSVGVNVGERDAEVVVQPVMLAVSVAEPPVAERLTEGEADGELDMETVVDAHAERELLLVTHCEGDGERETLDEPLAEEETEGQPLGEDESEALTLRVVVAHVVAQEEGEKVGDVD